jgi:hypothetical protein
MDVSLESVPRKGLLYEKVSSLQSVQRSYISEFSALSGGYKYGELDRMLARASSKFTEL